MKKIQGLSDTSVEVDIVYSPSRGKTFVDMAIFTSRYDGTGMMLTPTDARRLASRLLKFAERADQFEAQK